MIIILSMYTNLCTPKLDKIKIYYLQYFVSREITFLKLNCSYMRLINRMISLKQIFYRDVNRARLLLRH